MTTNSIIIGRMNDLIKSPEWLESYNLWLSSRQAESTRRSYGHIWKTVLSFLQKQPGEIDRGDIVRIINYLRERGLAPATIGQYIAGISSFYSYVGKYFTELRDDNPARDAPRPRVMQYSDAYYLTPEEASTLLKVIDRSTILGQRDYALFLAYIMLGRRNSEIRKLRWGDFEEIGDLIWYRWSGKGKLNERFECPRPVYDTICSYLEAAGRLNEIQDPDPIFTAVSGRFHRNGSETPISSRQVGRRLKKYAGLARLDQQRIHVHSLRHTATVLRMEAGDSISDLKEYLNHSSIVITQIYTHRLRARRDTSWEKVFGMLGIST